MSSRNRSSKMGLFLIIGVVILLIWGSSAVYAFPETRVDAPNPKIKPLVEDDDEIPNITDLADDYYGPGSYEIEIGMGGEVKLINQWCTKTEAILAQNLGSIVFWFDVNGSDQISNLHNYEEVAYDETGEKMFCHGYRGVISDWPPGEHVIYYDLFFDDPVNDGWDDYPSGDIVWEFVVHVNEGEPSLGDSLADGPQVTPLERRSLDIPHIRTLAKDYHGAGVYDVKMTPDGEIRASLGWCSKTAEILAQNLEHIRFSLEINGRNVLESYFNYDEVHYDYIDTGEAAYCFGYRALLHHWPPGKHSVRNTLNVDKALDDGWEMNQAGTFVYEYIVTVPGASTAPGGAPEVTVSQNTNCRRGPGKAYEINGELRVGEKADVVGKHPNSGYWIIIEPRFGRECWLWGNYAEVTGDISQLKVYTPPPLPTATPTPTPIPTVNLICFCNNNADDVASFQLFNDDTDEWVAELPTAGLSPGMCNCYSHGGPFPIGDYALEYRICNDGWVCSDLGASCIQSFDVATEKQEIGLSSCP